MYRTLFFSGGLIVAVATLFPSSDDDVAKGGEAADVRGVDTSDWAQTGNKVSHDSVVQSSKDGDDGIHSLRRQTDGHFYANGTVQGASTRFLVDTGASVIALTGADAQAAGLTWSSADIQTIGSGASGAVYGVPAMISEVEIGGVTQRNIRAVIIPEGLEISLLGQSFLSEINSVEIVKDQMIWKSDQ